jgi:hypothetical protein
VLSTVAADVLVLISAFIVRFGRCWSEWRESYATATGRHNLCTDVLLLGP